MKKLNWMMIASACLMCNLAVANYEVSDLDDDDCDEDFSDQSCQSRFLPNQYYEPDYDDDYEPNASWPSQRETFMDDLENE